MESIITSRPGLYLPKSISTIFMNHLHGIWVVLLSFTHLLSISTRKIKHLIIFKVFEQITHLVSEQINLG